MKKSKSTLGQGSGLHREAERILSGKGASIQKTPIVDPQAMIHELQVRQIELEMQDEELRKAQLKVEESRNKYADLYDFAPIGYFLLNQKGLIVTVNLTGARLLEVERSSLINRPFFHFVSPESRNVFNSHRREVFTGSGRRTCELKLEKKEGTPFYALMESVAVEESESNGIQWRCTISDITERKRAEEALRQAHEELERRVEERTEELQRANEILRYEISERKRVEEERERLIHELQDALAKVKTLRGLLPICASCKKIRDDQGYWNQIEAYVAEHSEAEFTHGLCPDCMKKLYGTLFE